MYTIYCIILIDIVCVEATWNLRKNDNAKVNETRVTNCILNRCNFMRYFSCNLFLIKTIYQWFKFYLENKNAHKSQVNPICNTQWRNIYFGIDAHRHTRPDVLMDTIASQSIWKVLTQRKISTIVHTFWLAKKDRCSVG